MIDQFQIRQQIPRNYAASSHYKPPYILQNPSAFSRPPTFNGHPPCRVNHKGRFKWNGNKLKSRNDKHRVNPNDSSKTNGFTTKFRQFHFQKRRFTTGRRFSPPLAPRNTTSFIIRTKKFGGIASTTSPCEMTPAVLTTPILPPSTEVVVEMAKEKWGVDGYGTMNGLIRVRSGKDIFDKTENNVSGQFEVRKTFNTYLSRFEMIYPSEYSLQNMIDEKELHITRLEQQNLTLKEKVCLIKNKLDELSRRILCLETKGIKFQDKSVGDDGESNDNGDC